MILIPRVRIRCFEERGLSAIELFILKSFLRHGKLRLDEVEVATGVPSGPLHVILYRLIQQGLLSDTDLGFSVSRNSAEKAVETGHCRQEVESTKDFIFLPRTGDLGVLGDSDFRRLEKIKPRCSAPVPPDIVGKETSGITADSQG